MLCFKQKNSSKAQAKPDQPLYSLVLKCGENNFSTIEKSTPMGFEYDNGKFSIKKSGTKVKLLIAYGKDRKNKELKFRCHTGLIFEGNGFVYNYENENVTLNYLLVHRCYRDFGFHVSYQEEECKKKLGSVYPDIEIDFEDLPLGEIKTPVNKIIHCINETLKQNYSKDFGATKANLQEKSFHALENGTNCVDTALKLLTGIGILNDDVFKKISYKFVQMYAGFLIAKQMYESSNAVKGLFDNVASKGTNRNNNMNDQSVDNNINECALYYVNENGVDNNMEWQSFDDEMKQDVNKDEDLLYKFFKAT